tara:strand:- start:6533 stop:7393 length:861 start_codon:yes stop_codon:yes gene_type:complete
MELLLLMLTAHFIANFYLQPASGNNSSNTKHIKPHKLWLHFIVYTLLYIMVFLFSELSLLSATIAIVIISLSYILSVYLKFYRVNNLSYFLLDQSIQLLIITLVWAYFSNVTLDQIIVFIAQFLTTKNMVIAISYLLVCKPASVIISLALKKHTDSLAHPATEPQAHSSAEINEDSNAKLSVSIIKNDCLEQLASPAAIDKNENIGLLSAGAWIGYIERCLAISFIFMGQFAGIGFLVATKTIFRFGDLTKNKDMKLTEYMMLGTLLSYAIALFVGWNGLRIYQAM